MVRLLALLAVGTDFLKAPTLNGWRYCRKHAQFSSHDFCEVSYLARHFVRTACARRWTSTVHARGTCIAIFTIRCIIFVCTDTALPGHIRFSLIFFSVWVCLVFRPMGFRGEPRRLYWASCIDVRKSVENRINEALNILFCLRGVGGGCN